VTLPPEYNLRFPFGGYVKQEVKILHGRASNYEEIAARLNASDDDRIFDQARIEDRHIILVDPGNGSVVACTSRSRCASTVRYAPCRSSFARWPANGRGSLQP
jgi:hypothetical protein